MTATKRAAIQRILVIITCVALGAAVPWRESEAQRVDTARVTPRPPAPVQLPAPTDSAKPPISPKRAFLYSFLVPGYGQSVLDRPIAGTLFFAAEVTWIALAVKAAADLRFARAHEADSIAVSYEFDPDGTVRLDSLGNPVPASYAPNRYAEDRVAARQKHLEDYYALLIANHLLAGAEAFVAAQLWDLPARVSIKALPFGAVFAATIRW